MLRWRLLLTPARPSAGGLITRSPMRASAFLGARAEPLCFAGRVTGSLSPHSGDVTERPKVHPC